MKLNRFIEQSLITNSYAVSAKIQAVLKENTSSDLSFLACLILLGLHYEENGDVGPSRMSADFGFPRSRVSQEITKLTKKGYLKRQILASNASRVVLKLTRSGSEEARALVKTFSQLQRKIDNAIGEKTAEQLCSILQKASNEL